MTIPVIQSLVAKNGKFIVLPPWAEGEANYGNLAHPAVYTRDVYAQYPINTKFVDGDRTWIYSKCGTTPTDQKIGCGIATDVSEDFVETDAVEHAIGETDIVLQITGVTSNLLDTTPALNLFAGGTFGSYPDLRNYRVVSSTIENQPTTGHTQITLETGLEVAIPASSAYNLLIPNMYSNVRNKWGVETSPRVTFVGVGQTLLTATYCQWLQTWGPAFMVANTSCGAADYKRDVSFWIDGSIIDSVAGYQHAGVLIAQDVAEDSAGRWFTRIEIER